VKTKRNQFNLSKFKRSHVLSILANSNIATFNVLLELRGNNVSVTRKDLASRFPKPVAKYYTTERPVIVCRKITYTKQTTSQKRMSKRLGPVQAGERVGQRSSRSDDIKNQKSIPGSVVRLSRECIE
jgi:hypothetical protein